LKPFINGIDSHYEIIVLSETEGKTKFKQIICVCSKEDISWENPAIQRANTFYLSLLESIGITPAKISQLKENYEGVDINGVPKDHLGKLFIKAMSKTSNMVHDELTSEDLITETSLAIDDDDITSTATEIDFDDEE
jgi:hypothetical protein